MRFFTLLLYANQQIGSDPLNNPINDLVKIGETVGRFSSWTSEEVALDKRDLTVNNRKIITREFKSIIEQADKIKFDGLYYSVKEIKGDDYSRWRIVVVNRYGSESL